MNLMILLLKTIENAPVSQWEKFQGFFQKWQDKSVPKEFSQYLREFLISLNIPAEDPSENIAQLFDTNSEPKEELLDALHILAFSSNPHVRLWSRIASYVLTPDAFAQKPNELPPFTDENEWNSLYEEYFSVWPAAFAAGLLTYQYTVVDENDQSQTTYKFNDASAVLKHRNILISRYPASAPYIADEDGSLAILERAKLDKKNPPLLENSSNISRVCPDIYENIETEFVSSQSMIIHLMLLHVGLNQGGSGSAGGSEERATVPAQRATENFFKLVEHTTDDQKKTLQTTGIETIYIRLRKPASDLSACVNMNAGIIDEIFKDDKKLKKLFQLKVSKKKKEKKEQPQEKHEGDHTLIEKIKDTQRHCAYENNKTLRNGDIETIRDLLLSVQHEESPTKNLYNQLGEHEITDSFLLSSIGAEIERMGFQLWIKSISDFHLLASLFKNDEVLLTKIKKWTLSNLKYTITSKNDLIGFIISAKDPKFVQRFLRKNPIDKSISISTHPDLEAPFNDYSKEFRLLIWDSLNLDDEFISQIIEGNKERFFAFAYFLLQRNDEPKSFETTSSQIIPFPPILLEPEKAQNLEVIKKEVKNTVVHFLSEMDEAIINSFDFMKETARQNILARSIRNNTNPTEQEIEEEIGNMFFYTGENDAIQKKPKFSLNFKEISETIKIDGTEVKIKFSQKQKDKLRDFYYKKFEMTYVRLIKSISDEDKSLKQKLTECPPEYPLSDTARMDLFLHATITNQDDYLSDAITENFNKTVFIERFIHRFFNAPLTNETLILLNTQLRKLLTSPNHPLRIPRGYFFTAQNGVTKSLKTLIVAILENIIEKIEAPTGSDEPYIIQRARLVHLLGILSVFLESIKLSNPTDYADIKKSIRDFRKSPKIASILSYEEFSSDEEDNSAAVVQPVVAQPVAVQPVAVQPVAVQPVAVQPVAVQPVAVQPVAVQPVAVQPVAVQPVAVQPVAVQPVAVQPVAVQPVAVQPVAVQPVAVQPVAVQPVAVQPVVVERERTGMDEYLLVSFTQENDYLYDEIIENFDKNSYIESFIHHFFNAPLSNETLDLLNTQLERLLTIPNHPLRIPRGRFLIAQNGITKSLKRLITAVLENISKKIEDTQSSSDSSVNHILKLLEILSTFLESIKRSNPTDYSEIQKSITGFKESARIASILRSHFKSEVDNENGLSAQYIIDSIDPFIAYPSDSTSYSTRAELRRAAYSVILSHLSQVLTSPSNQMFLEDFLAHDAPFNKESQFIIKKIASLPEQDFKRVIRYLEDLRNSDLFRVHLGYVSRVVSLSPTTTSQRLGSLITGLRRVHDQYHTSRPLPPVQAQTLISAP